MRYMN